MTNWNPQTAAISQYSFIFQTTKARQYLEKAAKAGHKGAPGTIGTRL